MQTEQEIISTNLGSDATDIIADQANSSSDYQTFISSSRQNPVTVPYPYETHREFYSQLVFAAVKYNYKELLTVMLYTPTEVGEYYQQLQQQQKDIENYTLDELASDFQVDAYTRLLDAVNKLPDTMTANEFVSSYQQALLTDCGNTAFANALAFLIEKQEEFAFETDEVKKLSSLSDDDFEQGLKSIPKHRQSLYQGARTIVERERSQLANDIAELTQQPLQGKQKFIPMLCEQLTAKIDEAGKMKSVVYRKRQLQINQLLRLKGNMYPDYFKRKLDIIKHRKGLFPILQKSNLRYYEISSKKNWPALLTSLEQITISLDIRDEHNNTLLHAALHNSALSCARLIMKKQQENLNNAVDNEAEIDLVTSTNILGETPVQYASLDENSLFFDAALHPDKPMSDFRSDFLKSMRKVLKKYHDKATQLHADINFREKEQIFPAEIEKTLSEIEQLEHACQVAELELMDEFIVEISKSSSYILAGVALQDKPSLTTKRNFFQEILLRLSPNKMNMIRDNIRGYFNLNLHREIHNLVKCYNKNKLVGHHFYGGQNSELTFFSEQVATELEKQKLDFAEKSINPAIQQVNFSSLEALISLQALFVETNNSYNKVKEVIDCQGENKQSSEKEIVRETFGSPLTSVSVKNNSISQRRRHYNENTDGKINNRCSGKHIDSAISFHNAL